MRLQQPEESGSPSLILAEPLAPLPPGPIAALRIPAERRRRRLGRVADALRLGPPRIRLGHHGDRRAPGELGADAGDEADEFVDVEACRGGGGG